MVGYTPHKIGACDDIEVPWEKTSSMPAKPPASGDDTWPANAASDRHQQPGSPDSGPTAQHAAGDEEKGGQGWQQHSRLSASALRRRRRQRATSLAAKFAMERQGQRTAGEGQTQTRPPARTGKAGVAGKGNGKSVHCAKLMEGLEAGGKARATAVTALRGCVVPLSFDAAGCRAVQQALHVVDRKIAVDLAAELRGHVCEAIRSPHANYVIQKVIEVLPMAQASFVADELRGMGVEVARHRYGCRILCRLLEHSASDAGPVALIDEVLGEVSGLCRHSFGHYVIQSVLEHGSPEQRQQIAAALRGELSRSVQNRNACYVIENALSYCSVEDRQALVEGLLNGGPGRLAALAQHQFGSHVVRALLRLPGEGAQVALGQLQAVSGQLQTTKYGRRLLEDFSLAHAEGGAERSNL
mmetsp:Transcript_36814/g.83297  ORF Transcript_36814/g.83297 Transcript_36814/m.83297 type:complete len:413 (+) Transcript_36814:62-1300(+)